MRAFAVATAAVVVMSAGPVQAHETLPVPGWASSPLLWSDLADLIGRSRARPVSAPGRVPAPTPHGADGNGAEGRYSVSAAPYGDLIAAYFPVEWHEWAVRVMLCESGGNPDAVNPTSGAAGLFQHMPQFWPARATAAGFPGASPFDPEANIATSAWLLATGGPGHWVCKG